MNHPVRYNPDDHQPTRYWGPPAPVVRPRRRPSYARPSGRFDSGTTDSPAVRAILALVAMALIAALVYLLSLSSRPTINDVMPAPNSTADPGVVVVQADVDAPKPIQQVVLRLNEQEVSAAVTVLSEQSWRVRFQEVLPPGTYHARVTVIDISGGVQEHEWSFKAAGPTIEPTITITGPPENEQLAPGLIRLSVEISNDAKIESAELLLNGEEIPVTITEQTTEHADELRDERLRVFVVSAEQALPAGTHKAELTVTDEQDDTASQEWQFALTNDPSRATARYFSATGHYVRGPFKTFWEANAGAKLFGDPISREYVNEDGLTVQYFEYVRFELNQEQQISLGLLGREAYDGVGEPVTDPDNPTIRYFPETGHTISGPFRDYWEANGGITIFGFPITEIIDEDGMRVQYFERARFELNPSAEGQIDLTPLGTMIWERQP